MINGQYIDYPYFTVLVKFKGDSQWYPQFGDEEKEIAREEAEAYREDGHRTKIIITEFREGEPAVNDAVFRFNRGLSVPSL